MTSAPPPGPRPSRKAKAQRAAKPGSSRLSSDDWLDGALHLLAREGVSAIRIPRLCAELGVTKGSFYWHFDDIGQLREAMAERWSSQQADKIRELGEIESLPVAERVERMAEQLIDRGTLAVELSVREWARDDAQVAATVQALDRRIFEVIQKTLLDLDFNEFDARVRAGVLVYAGIGFLHGHTSLPTPTTEEVHALLALLTQR